MKVVALVSGGKDSCFSVLKCLNYGHNVIVLANLAPAPGNPDDLDSFMFQTVGHEAIEYIAKAADLVRANKS